MLQLIEKLKHTAHVLDSFEKLGQFVSAIHLDELQYKQYIPGIGGGKSYTRNILMMQPVEVALLYWPPGAQSAVHRHEGFYGYVIVLEGELDNTEYNLEGNELKEMQGMRAIPGGILPEPDGVIHKLTNGSADKFAVSLHIYMPPLETLEGMQIFDLEKGRTGILSSEAKTASWLEPKTAFQSIQENAFTYLDYGKHTGDSHGLFPILPKPDKDIIYSMIGGYYNEQAQSYDEFDATHGARHTYISKVNELIAADIARLGRLDTFLALACGTGRRTLEIQQLSGRQYHITGIDLSSEMTAIAREKGVEAYNSRWLTCELPHKNFSAITFLYAFGHICNAPERKQALQKVYDHLAPGAPFYFDVFNLHDENEWGPRSERLYRQLALDKMGYDRGDVFYKRNDGDAIAYLHYFAGHELNALLQEIGFGVEWIKHIGYRIKPGEEIKPEEGGKLFIKAVKV